MDLGCRRHVAPFSHAGDRARPDRRHLSARSCIPPGGLPRAASRLPDARRPAARPPAPPPRSRPASTPTASAAPVWPHRRALEA